MAAEAVANLAGLGYAPPLDSAGNPVEIHIFSSSTEEGRDSPGEAVDAPNDGLTGPSFINLSVGGFADHFNDDHAICDPWLVAVVLHHEYSHCVGGGYPGNEGDVCGEWAANLGTLALICDLLTEYGHLPFTPIETLCTEACDLVAWFAASQDAFFGAACTGSSGAIPTVCPDCEC